MSAYIWGLCLGAFLLGSIPFGRLIGHYAAGVDVRKVGSGNIGATNVARTLGIRWGALTLALDILKGLVPVMLVRAAAEPETTGLAAGLVGIMALIGHQFSIFLRFRGGKGVATALGFFLAIAPLASLVGLAVFTLVFCLWRIVSLASLAAALAMPLVLGLLAYPTPTILTAWIATLLIFAKHHGNIGRLWRWEEPGWGKGGSTPGAPASAPTPRQKRNG